VYYLLETDYFVKPEAFRTRLISDDFGYSPSKFLRGRHMDPRDAPLEMEAWERGANRDGLAELFLDSVPLFRDDFLSAIREAGVTNIEDFPVVLRNAEKGLELTNYKAVNILGLVACADMKKSEFTDVTGTGMIAVAFRKLVIDEKAAQGLYMFRLGQAVASIIVHERVKAHLDKMDFKYVSWRSLAA